MEQSPDVMDLKKMSIIVQIKSKKLQVACEFIFESVPTRCPGSSIVSPLRFCWVKDVSLLGDCGNTGMEQTLNKSQHKKVKSGEENSPAAPARIQIRNLSIMSLALLPASCPGQPVKKIPHCRNMSRAL